MLFSEIYGSYFNVVAAVLSEASDGKLTDRRMTELVREKAFAESALAIPAALKSGTWPLLDQEYHSILHHKPTMPLTMLQKRWLKALLSDPRIALFDPDTTGLEDVDPLYAQDTFILFDQYADGDPYGDPAYIACFQTALKAIRKKRKLRIRFRGHTGARHSIECIPYRLEYSANLGYSLYKQRKFKEAQSVFEDCLRQNRDVRYAANNLVRTLLAQGKNGEAQRVIQEHERFVSKDLKKRAEKPVGKVKIAVPEPAVTDVEAETIVDIGVKKQQFSSEKLLEDELVQRMEIGIPVFGMPLRIYQKRGVYGRQFVLRNGRLDILGIDTAGDLYVIELKKDSGYDDAYAQTREYIDWIEEDVAVKGQRVFGIICLNDPTKDLIEKVKADDQMRLFEYSISYSEII